MDGPVDWWWKMSLLDVCVQAGFCQIRSHIIIITIYIYSRLQLLAVHVQSSGDRRRTSRAKSGDIIYVHMTHNRIDIIKMILEITL